MSSINQKPVHIFSTGGIKDPIVQQNFDQLNRFLTKLQQAKQPPAANIVVSKAFPAAGQNGTFSGGSGGNKTEFRPGGLAATITTKGNPVTVKIAAAYFSNNSRYWPQFLISNSNHAFADIAGGFYRSANGQTPQLISMCYLNSQAGGSLNFNQSFMLPVFEFTDYNVPSGTWTYQFYLWLFGDNTNVAMEQVVVQAKEER